MTTTGRAGAGSHSEPIGNQDRVPAGPIAVTVDAPSLTPFRPISISVGLYRLSAAKIDIRIQREMLGVLHSEFPSLEQVPGGFQFADRYKGRALTVDHSKVELEDQDPEAISTSIDYMRGVLDKVLANLGFPPPYRIRLEMSGTIQGLGGVDPARLLMEKYPPRPAWFADISGEQFAAVRYTIQGPDQSVRDYKVEPWFQKAGHFFVAADVYSPPAGKDSLADAMAWAREEAERARSLADTIATDLVKGKQ